MIFKDTYFRDDLVFSVIGRRLGGVTIRFLDGYELTFNNASEKEVEALLAYFESNMKRGTT